jgi:hypothetical protein
MPDDYSTEIIALSTIFGAIIGAIIAAVVGYIVSKKQFKDQLQLKLKNTALDLVNEIESLEKIIKPFANCYEENGIHFIVDRKTDPIANLTQVVFFSENDMTPEILKFLCDVNSAYYRYKDVIPNFDEECFVGISEFYQNIICAQNYYHLYGENLGNYYLGKTYEHLIKASHISENVKDMLKTRYILKNNCNSQFYRLILFSYFFHSYNT